MAFMMTIFRFQDFERFFSLRPLIIFSNTLHIVQKSLEMSHLDFQSWHFPPIFVLLKVTSLVTLFVHKVQVSKNSPNWTIFGIFMYIRTLPASYKGDFCWGDEANLFFMAKSNANLTI